METHEPDEQALLAAARQQKIDAARGCLVAIVLETAALLAGLLWLVTWWLEAPKWGRAAALSFFVFTAAAILIAGLVVVLGNLPKNRKLREAAHRATSAPPADD